MKKLFLLSSLITISLLLPSVIKAETPTPTPTVSLSNSYCSFSPANAVGQPTGNVTLSSNCVVYENVNGVVDGNLTISPNATITLHKTLAFSPGFQIDIQETGSGVTKQTGIVYVNTGGSIIQGKLCVKDADNDHYADTVSVSTDPYGTALAAPITQIDEVVADSATNLCPSGYNFRESMNNLSQVDTDTTTSNTAKVATSDRELLRLGFTVGGVKDVMAAGNPVKIVGDNLLVCQAAGCPAVSFAAVDGNAYISQRVGIGMTNPAYPLDVNGTLNATALYVNGSPYIGSQWTTTGSNIYYTTGKVGIGTTNPLYQLAIKGAGPQVFVSNADFVQGTTGSGFYIQQGAASGETYTQLVPFKTGNTAYSDFIITGNNVGIGISNPTYKLQVAGTLYAGGSSRDYKQNITPLTLDSSKIYDLNPVSYDYKSAYQSLGYSLAGGHQIGLIAEDVAKVYPELAITLDRDGVKNKISNVDYEKLSVLLLAEMKNQKKEIDSLKNQLNDLEQKLIQIEAKLK